MDTVILTKDELFDAMEIEIDKKIYLYSQKLARIVKKIEIKGKTIVANNQIDSREKSRLVNEHIEENIRCMTIAREECRARIKDIVILKQIDLMKQYHKILNNRGDESNTLREEFGVYINQMNSYREKKIYEIINKFYVYLVKLTGLYYQKFCKNFA